MASTESTNLTQRQQSFVDAYLITLNATESARQAGYSGDDNTLAVAGSKLVRNGKVAAAIGKAMAKRSERTEITQDWVLEKLKENAERALQAVAVLDKEGEFAMYFLEGVQAKRPIHTVVNPTGRLAKHISKIAHHLVELKEKVVTEDS